MNKFCDQRTTIGFIALIDMAFGAILFCLYCRKLLFFYVADLNNSGDEFTPPSMRMLVLFPIILNGFQILVAYHLLMSTRLVDPFRSLAKATMWFQTAALILTFLCLKFLLLLLFPPGTGDSNLPMTLLIWETMFKIVSIYFVKNYLDELKQLVCPPPNVQFSVYVPPSPTSNGPDGSAVTLTPVPRLTPVPMGTNALNFPIYMNRPASPGVTPVYV